MNYEETIKYIHSFNKFGSRLGLDRIKRLMSLLGDPQDELRFIHIAGTNGKGSTSKMISAVLTASGYRCGLYTSPYVIEFGERMQIDGEMIPHGALCRNIERVKAVIDEHFADDIPTEFELITAAAFCWYAEEKVDYVVLEVGLGGRLDATNVIRTSLVSVITRIDLDHTAILGDTLAKIATEKAGIFRSGVPAVTTGCQDAEALAAIKEKAELSECPLTVTPVPENVVVSKDGTEFSYNGNKYSLKLIGKHQADNASLALAAIKVSGIPVTEDAVREGLRAAVMPARTELISSSPFVMLDGSHNPAGVAALDRTLDALGVTNAVGIVGMMADKDVEGALSGVLSRFSDIITVTVASNPRTMQSSELANICRKRVKNVFAAPNYEAAILLADTLSASRPIICFGSLYLAGDIREMLKEFFGGDL